jgi:GT2 family glycosyltransferase
MLRAYENSGERGVGHISDVLCHRPDDVGSDSFLRDEIISSRRSVLQGHLARMGTSASVEDGVLPSTFHIRYHHNEEAAVSIIIPTLNGGAMLQSSVNAVVENTEFKNWELIVVDRESDDAATMAFLDYLRDFNNDAIRVITKPRSASFPAVRNAGAQAARQDYLLFLSDSTQPLRKDWLDEMLGYAVQSGVGVVGAKAVGTDGNVSNAGYVLGLGGQPAGLHDLHASLDDPGYFGRLQVPGNPSAVSATCLLTEKKLFDELGGFDEHLLAAGYSDVDYCLKVGKAKQRVVWTPFALMFQPHEIEPPEEIEVDEDADADAETHRSRILPGPTAQVMFDRWRDRIAFDPAYNRNLSLSLAASESYVRGFEIETLPALTWDPDFRPMPRVFAFTGGGEGREENRIVAPMRALVNAGKIQGADAAEFLSIPELARISPDVLIFQYRQEGYQPKLIESYARNSRALRIFELDVFLSNTQLYQDNSLADTLNLSDRLVVPTEYLAHEYRKFSPELHVVPDHIERARWGALNPKRSRDESHVSGGLGVLYTRPIWQSLQRW